jgi:TPR repeat protein
METQMNVFLAKLLRCLAIGLACFALAANAGDFEDTKRKAEAGDAQAQFDLGRMLYSGQNGAPKDLTEAIKWVKKAAEQGHAVAQHILGAAYYHGDGVKKNDAEAAKWYRKAAEQGEMDAQWVLAKLYLEGRGVTQSFKEAEKWIRKAAAQGHEGAKDMLHSEEFDVTRNVDGACPKFCV